MKKEYTINVDISVLADNLEQATLLLQDKLQDNVDNLPICGYWIGDVTEVKNE